MTATTASAAPTNRTAARIVLGVQILVGVFFIVASAAPKLFGEASAVQIFTEIGAGQWFRYLVGALELAGGIGLLTRLAGPAALGLIGVMVGAAFTQLFILSTPVLVVTPIIIGAVLVVIARFRRSQITDLLENLRRRS